ncbi:BAG family molecular chaperone regulator 1 isoform X1 [Lagenorhynchus albirostris]|uniref:BAG family molecular chaperone regulator 1 isoform X1 n=1 Tax=Lagenorhynchus albirostris TaxID=27610 RepID=UPI0028E3E0BE|nr:BAG family molecular chaperone regulator 1 isoform X1 [Lagenorhynchus albirostris]
MAAAGLSVTVTHSNEKHDLQVIPQEGCSEPIVQDLAQVVEEATGVPLPFQKLIFKGKSLKEMETPLSALGIQNGCRVMLIGKKNSPEEEAEIKKLKDLEKSVEKIADQLEELSKELTGIQQGFLAKDLQAEALCKLDRRVIATVGQFMKILEEIDTLYRTHCLRVLSTYCVPDTARSLVNTQKGKMVPDFSCPTNIGLLSYYLCIYLFILATACGILVPRSGIEPMPLHWECRILTTGLPGKSLLFLFMYASSI